MSKYFSIIVPIFNCEKYLRQCLDSVLHQTCQDFELILVDDGSTDGSLAICREYTGSNVKIISQENAGVSVARNVGLSHATGKYVVFLDSDDWLWPDLLEYVHSKDCLCIDCFVGMFNTHLETENSIPVVTERMSWEKINYQSAKDVLQYFHQLRLILTVWRFIAKRSIIVENGLRFEKNLLHEDEVFASILLSKCDTFYLVCEP